MSIVIFLLIPSSLLLGSATGSKYETDENKPNETVVCARNDSLGPCSFNNCKDVEPIALATYGQKDIAFLYCAETWAAAQAICIHRGGHLWESKSKDEYRTVFAAIGYSAENRQPSWLYAYFYWWMGFTNQDNDRARGRGHSSGELAGWQPLREFQKGEDCVNIYENIVQWGDLPCAQKLPFICESKRPCRCKYGSREYPCDRPIGTLAHCCTHVHCDAQGYIRTWSLSDPLSGVKSNKCCPYGTELVQDGETVEQRFLCCRGRLWGIK